MHPGKVRRQCGEAAAGRPIFSGRIALTGCGRKTAQVVSCRDSPLPGNFFAVSVAAETKPLSPCASAEAATPDLRAMIARAASLLPTQGPIRLFIHNNTLAALEHLPFAQAVVQGGQLLGAEPYWPEDRYRQLLHHGRITTEDLSAVLLEDLGDDSDRLVGLFGTRFHLRLAMLGCPLDDASHAELRWLVAESDALVAFRADAPAAVRRQMIDDTRQWVLRDVLRTRRVDGAPASGPRCAHASDDRGDAALANVLLAGVIEHFGATQLESWRPAAWESFCLHALWRVCYHGVRYVWSGCEPPEPPLRHRAALLESTAVDIDQLVGEVLIRFCAAFLDQGQAEWSLPERERGLWASFLALYGGGNGPLPHWMRGLPHELRSISTRGLTALESIRESLDVLGVAVEQREDYLAATLCALRGWAGMIWQMETRADRVPRPAPRGSLEEFLAVRLVLERLALAHVAGQHLDFHGPLAQLSACALGPRDDDLSQAIEQRAFAVFQLAQVLGWKPSVLYRMGETQWNALATETESFSGLERRRIFHLALERNYRRQALGAVAQRAAMPPTTPRRPKLQVVCCLDDREESLRRHLEELEPEVETFGSAGFFAVAMYYRGAADAKFVPLCPVAIRPQHYVEEVVDRDFEAVHRRHGRARRWLAAVSQHMRRGSRSFTVGALLSATLGPLASAPLLARVIAPRLTARIRRRAGRWVQPPRLTQLQLERAPKALSSGRERPGYTVEEMAAVVQRLLGDIGLTRRFARLVFVLGHGSSAMNNPHKAAYHCAACGGGSGGPNARALAQMANDPRVRRRLAERGVEIPPETWFVAGSHNTCDEQLTLFDLERLPVWLREDLDAALDLFSAARLRNAHERCRKFAAAPLDITAEGALRHVESRGEDLAQTRAEIGHAGNALCIVGRRARTRGLFLDRRAFLVSYDPQQDGDDKAILARILQAVVPVCGGINLDYYFSTVDPVGWGSGTKLPHNITSLLGVMDGAASDLRPGLPAQMTELHEPMRLLFVVECEPDALEKIISANPVISRMVHNGWVQVATLDPGSSRMHYFRRGKFEPWLPQPMELARVQSSREWYSQGRDPLPYALVEPSLTVAGQRALDDPRPEPGAPSC